MSAGFACEPTGINIGLSPSVPSKDIVIRIVSGDIAPNSSAGTCYCQGDCPEPGGQGPRTYIRVENNSIATLAIPSLGVTASPGVTTKYCASPADAMATVLAIAVYNGVTGSPRRGPVLDATVSYNGLAPATDGEIKIWFGIPEYGAYPNLNGTPHYLITVSSIPAGNALDTFKGPDNAQLAIHSPDVIPAGGATSDWHGTGAYSADINNNELVVGGATGDIKIARLFAGTKDKLLGKFFTYADWLRAPNTITEYLGVVCWCDYVAGNNDTGLQQVQFFAENIDTNTVRLSWRQYNGVTQVAGDSAFMNFAWTRGQTRRMMIRMIESVMYLYVENASGVMTKVYGPYTMPTPWNDVNHQYAGLIYRHAAGGQKSIFWAVDEVKIISDTTAVVFNADHNALSDPRSKVINLTASNTKLPITELSTVIEYAGTPTGWLTATLNTTVVPATLTLTVNTSLFTDGVSSINTATVRILSNANNGNQASGAPEIAVTFNMSLYTIETAPVAAAATPEEICCGEV